MTEMNVEVASTMEYLRRATELKSKVHGSEYHVEDSETAVLHDQLRNLLTKIILQDVEFALDNKIEHDLWNVVFKNPISAMQKLSCDKKNVGQSRHYSTILNAFLDSALGYYTLLLKTIVLAHNIDLDFMRNYGCPSWFCDDLIMSANSTVSGDTTGGGGGGGGGGVSLSSCHCLIQDCLVHMGDLARYRNRHKQADTLYRHAMQLVPSSGQPYNQLALLATQHGDSLSPLYYYVRSVTVRSPFAAAAHNLARIYSRVASQSVELPDGCTGLLSVSTYILLFLQLHARIYQLVENGEGECGSWCSQLVQQLMEQLPRLLLEESFSQLQLVQMLVITLYGIHHATTTNNNNNINPISSNSTTGNKDSSSNINNNCTGNSISRNNNIEHSKAKTSSSVGGSSGSSSSDSRCVTSVARCVLLRLVCDTLCHIVRVSYRVHDTDSLRQYAGLIAVKLYLSWLLQSDGVLSCSPFADSDCSLWPLLCHLANRLSSNNNNNSSEDSTDVDYLLPEDEELLCFSLIPSYTQLTAASHPPPSPTLCPLYRCRQLLTLCRQLQQRHVLQLPAPAAAGGGGGFSCRNEQLGDEQQVLKQLQLLLTPPPPAAAAQATCFDSGAVFSSSASQLAVSQTTAPATAPATPASSRTHSATSRAPVASGILKHTKPQTVPASSSAVGSGSCWRRSSNVAMDTIIRSRDDCRPPLSTNRHHPDTSAPYKQVTFSTGASDSSHMTGGGCHTLLSDLLAPALTPPSPPLPASRHQSVPLASALRKPATANAAAASNSSYKTSYSPPPRFTQQQLQLQQQQVLMSSSVATRSLMTSTDDTQCGAASGGGSSNNNSNSGSDRFSGSGSASFNPTVPPPGWCLNGSGAAGGAAGGGVGRVQQQCSSPAAPAAAAAAVTVASSVLPPMSQPISLTGSGDDGSSTPAFYTLFPSAQGTGYQSFWPMSGPSPLETLIQQQQQQQQRRSAFPDSR